MKMLLFGPVPGFPCPASSYDACIGLTFPNFMFSALRSVSFVH